MDFEMSLAFTLAYIVIIFMLIISFIPKRKRKYTYIKGLYKDGNITFLARKIKETDNVEILVRNEFSSKNSGSWIKIHETNYYKFKEVK